MKNELKLFEAHQVRTAWDETQEQWLYSIVDIIAALTANPQIPKFIGAF